MPAGRTANRPADQVAQETDVHAADLACLVEHADKGTTPLAQDQASVGGLTNLDHVSLFTQDSIDLPKALLRSPPRDPRPVVIGNEAGDSLDDILCQTISADFANGTPDRRHHELLIAGKQQQQGRVRRKVDMLGTTGTGGFFQAARDKSGSNQLPELLRDCRTSYPSMADKFCDCQGGFPNQQLDDSHAGGTVRGIRH